MINLNELNRHPGCSKFFLDCVNHMTSGTVTCVDYQPERLEFNHANVAKQVFNIGLQNGLLYKRTLLHRRLEVVCFGQLLDSPASLSHH